MPVGGALALWAEARPGRLGPAARHGIMAFGGGVLVAAVALVLLPHGSEWLRPGPAIVAFACGGLAFAAVDRALKARGRSQAQFLAMLTDFLPEALALGALLVSGSHAGALLAMLIALQNLPEGFNAFDEARRSRNAAALPLLFRFSLLTLLGPLMALIGVAFVEHHPEVLGAVMLFSAGGILYLTFEDIAPGAHAAASGLPALGAVGGFTLGLAGDLFIG
jgi:ZIP family zinc transporter